MATIDTTTKELVVPGKAMAKVLAGRLPLKDFNNLGDGGKCPNCDTTTWVMRHKWITYVYDFNWCRNCGKRTLR